MSTQSNLTILFADVCRSTQLFEQYGDVEAREIIGGALRGMSEIAREHGGRVVKTIGDEIMCTLPDATSGVLAAREMQKYICTDDHLQSRQVNIRSGLHFGEVIVEDDGDVFGDAVNVAARMAGLAKAQQIVTTKSTTDEVHSSANIELRPMGKTRVKGKLLPIDIVDVLWQEDNSNVTMVAQAIRIEDLAARASMKVSFRGREIELKDSSPPLRMGRDPMNDLVLDDEWVSRNHASIEFRQGFFIIVDRSTNGTYVQIEGDDELRLHRDEIHLRKKGVISLGQIQANRDENSLIRFECQLG